MVLAVVWTALVIITLVSMGASGRMAVSRGRSVRTWLWVSALGGPIGPLALLLLGRRSGYADHGQVSH